MSLESGRYYIMSPFTNRYLGRAIPEDRSLYPKKVIHGSTGEPQSSDGSYIPYIGDAYTAAIDKYLYAILLSDPEPEHWKITSTGENGRYIIQNAKESAGWALSPSSDPLQVQVFPLRIVPTVPPIYPANGILEFIPVPDTA